MNAILTAEQISKATDDLDGIANIRAINRMYREQDESHLWPIDSQFDATERSIRRVRKYCAAYGGAYGLEYCYMIEAELSDIVNSENSENSW